MNPEKIKPQEIKVTSRPSYLAPLIIGGALILFGILFLLNNFHIVEISVGAVFAGIFALAGLIFLIVFFLDREQWWALIPGFVLMGVGGTILVGEYVHLRGVDLGGAIMLGFIALPFWIIFILKRDYWWALFPAGVLTSIALMTLIPSRLGDAGVAVMFFGWAGTFLLVYLPRKTKVGHLAGHRSPGAGRVIPGRCIEYFWLPVADRDHCGWCLLDLPSHA